MAGLDAHSVALHPSDHVPLSQGYGARPRPNSIAGYNNAAPAGYLHSPGLHPAPGTSLADPSAGPDANSNYGRFHEEFDMASQRGSMADILTGDHLGPAAAASGVHRSDSQISYNRSTTPTPGLAKRASLRKRPGSLRRSGSRRSLRAGSVRSLSLGDKEKYGAEGGDDVNSAFYVPIPTSGNPTEILADRFQAWRKVLKDLIVFFKDLQKSYETRAKLLLSASNVINNIAFPVTFLQSQGLADSNAILRDYHKHGLAEANKAKEIESEVILQLTGLRSDLHQKTKEIKSLSGDFKNSVDKEVEGTRKAVRHLQEALGLVDTDPSATLGKGDPFIMRLHVDKQIEKQIDEENYLHRAYMNLESSGRELESIVVGEIQKAYSAYANILKREADEAYDTVERLQTGPLLMPKDFEWNAFLASTDELVDPRVPLRHVENINYPGKDHPAAVEVRAGMLERKSKYLKSYTPGWYILSPTHLHEFKSADRVAWQTPVMSLYLPEQKLGSHSQPGSASHKFMLKGRQTGTIHRGHSWVFRAESHETMMAWYEAIESLMGKTGEARNAFVRRHVRSISGGASIRTGSASSNDGAMEEDDEADRTPYSAESVVLSQEPQYQYPEASREPGGRFPSDVQLDRNHLLINHQAPLSPSSGESSGGDRDLPVAVVAGSILPESGIPLTSGGRPVSDREHNPHQQTQTHSGNSYNNNNNRPVETHASHGDGLVGPVMVATAATLGRTAQPHGDGQPTSRSAMISSSSPPPSSPFPSPKARAGQQEQWIEGRPLLVTTQETFNAGSAKGSQPASADAAIAAAAAPQHASGDESSTVPTSTAGLANSSWDRETDGSTLDSVSTVTGAAGDSSLPNGQVGGASIGDNAIEKGMPAALPPGKRQLAGSSSASTSASASAVELQIPGGFPPSNLTLSL